MIQVLGVRKEYTGRCVLDVPSLCFEQGKRYALLGANGSGKSTLLKILAGIIKPTEGTVQSEAAGKNAVGYMPQKPYGFSFSVLRNVTMAIDACPNRKEIAKSAIGAVGMSALINADASKLSGGETQRIAFARIIAIQRKLLLLDEPTASTDLNGIDLLEKALLNYCGETGCTVIFATHSPAQAMRLANQVIFLQQGLIAEHGESKQVLHEPQSKAAQAFLNHWKL